jgi:hypothetical protein
MRRIPAAAHELLREKVGSIRAKEEVIWNSPKIIDNILLARYGSGMATE